MSAPLPHDALDQIFLSGRSNHRFLPRPVEDATITELHRLTQLAPTGFNAQPARFLFIRSNEAKQRLGPALSGGNRYKTLAAPLNVVVAWDNRFPDHLAERFPASKAKSFFDANPGWIEKSGVSNAWLQAGFLIVAARALGLDAGPMTGFNPTELDREFFPDGRHHALLVINLGYGDRSELSERGPRLAFEDAVTLL